MTFDISDTLAPNSDQLDAVDLLGSPPQVFTITDVSKGNPEQPVSVRLAEFPRVWRPSKGMRRVLARCWGKDASQWVGRRVELYCDPEVTFGKEKVGGIRISRLSHIDRPTSVPMIVGRGKGGSWQVEPLPNAAPAKTSKPPSLKDRLTAGMKARGITEREDALAYVESIIGRAAPSSELSDEEMARVVEALEQPIGVES